MKIRAAGLLTGAAVPAAVALTLVGIAPGSASPARAKRLPCHASMSNSHLAGRRSGSCSTSFTPHS